MDFIITDLPKWLRVLVSKFFLGEKEIRLASLFVRSTIVMEDTTKFMYPHLHSNTYISRSL